jgi:integrase
MPATAETLLEYVSHLIAADRAPATIEQAVAAIRTHHRIAGFNNTPDTQAARLALRGYRRERAAAGTRARKSAPVTVDVLRQLLEVCDPSTLAGMRDRVLLVLGYVLFSRRSELSGLQIEDVEAVDGGLYILIRASNDTLRRTSGANAMVGMSGEAINQRLRVLAKRADVRHADRITAHGLRSGPATTAAKRGTAVSAIADQGRWSRTSPVVFGYIREADRWNQYPDIGL